MATKTPAQVRRFTLVKIREAADMLRHSAWALETSGENGPYSSKAYLLFCDVRSLVQEMELHKKKRKVGQ
jgi:hypothetical protein